MQSLPGLIAVLVLAASIVFAKDDLGPFADARSTWPDAFRPGKLASIDLANEALYAFAGEAESFFSGEFAESDAELYEEATLDAKARFYETMSEGDPSLSVTFSGLRVAYRWAEGPMRRVVCIVPRRNVKVSSLPSPAPPVSDTAPPGLTSNSTAPDSAESAPLPSVPSSDGEETRLAGNNTPHGSSTASEVASDAALVPDNKAVLDETPVETKIRACRDRLAETPNDPFLRLRLARLFAQSGQASRATRHYRALVKQLASNRNSMPPHDAASAMVEAAEHARATGNEAQALKFYRSAWKLNDHDLQPRITAAIALLRLHTD